MRGDEITAVDGVAFTDHAGFDGLLDAATGEVALSVQSGGAIRTVSIAPGPADPVLLGMVQAVEALDCRTVSIAAPSAEQTAAIAAGAFDSQKGFRCKDAHTALAPAFQSGDAVMIRGGRRVLLTMPGWGTTCVQVADYDGEGLTAERLAALLEGVAAPYVQDRHDNP